MNLSEWYSATETYQWSGHKIVYRIERSEKPWLLLIHGFPTASFDWWKIWKPLSEHYSLIAPDMIGFGYSDKPKTFPYSIMKQADLIEDLLTTLEISDCHILSHDYGDTVTQELIARHNEGNCSFEINSACLLNGGIFPESHHPILIQRLLISPIGPMLSRMLNQHKFAKSFGSIFGVDTRLTADELVEYWRLVSYNEGHRIAHKIIRYMRERVINRERWVGALQHYQPPLSLINGLVDPISGRVMVNRYREIISENDIFTLEAIGHYPQLEAPDKMLVYYFNWRNQTPRP
jgi:pimeloyl-ACP methyl ester carboxylesterase